MRNKGAAAPARRRSRRSRSRPRPQVRSSCRRWANPSSKAPSPSGSKRPATRSRKTSRCSKSLPTKSTLKSLRRMDGVLTEIKFEEGATVQVNTVVAMLGRRRFRSPHLRRSRSRPQKVRNPSQHRRPPRRSQKHRKSRRKDAAPRRSSAASPRNTTSISPTSPAPAPTAASHKDDILALSQPARCTAPSDAAASDRRAFGPIHSASAARRPALNKRPRTDDQNARHHRRSAWSRACTSSLTRTPSTKST